MLQALQLAEYGRYTVAPNPLVGCVIEKDGVVVGKGWHKKAGTEHAEVIALREAGDKACDANVYVTLEPCCHYGRTPPCVDALIAAQVKSVHIPFIDPNPLVNGLGVEKLKAAGIAVYIGEEEALARQQNEVFLHYITTNRPYVLAKWAMSLDGRIAADSGDAKWITSVQSREHAHYSRLWLGAVLVGVDTVIADDPILTPHLCKVEQSDTKPYWRIILDSQGRTPLNAQVLCPNSNSNVKTIIATTEHSLLTWRETMVSCYPDVEVLILPSNELGKVDLLALLAELGKRKISGLLVEGGQKVLTSFFKQQLVNKVHVYIAPKLIGGSKNRSPLAALNILNSSVAQAINLIHEKHELIADDIFIAAKPQWNKPCLPE